MAAASGASFQMSGLHAAVIAHLLGVAVLVLILVWILHFQGGVSWQSGRFAQNLNVHPLFMVLGLVVCTGEAILAYKTIFARREVKKTVHLLLHLLALAFAAVGLQAVFKFRHDFNSPDLHSLHSWLGIATVALYALQWLVALFCFVFPGAVMTMRAHYVPWHIFFGVVIFLMAVCTAETGLQKFTVSDWPYPSKAFVVNFTGVAILMFAVAVVLTVILPSRY